jgi:hypothetical protein
MRLGGNREATATSYLDRPGHGRGSPLTFAWLLGGVLLGGVLLGGLVGYLDGYWHATVDLTMTERKDRAP